MVLITLLLLLLVVAFLVHGQPISRGNRNLIIVLLAIDALILILFAAGVIPALNR